MTCERVQCILVGWRMEGDSFKQMRFASTSFGSYLCEFSFESIIELIKVMENVYLTDLI